MASPAQFLTSQAELRTQQRFQQSEEERKRARDAQATLYEQALQNPKLQPSDRHALLQQHAALFDPHEAPDLFQRLAGLIHGQKSQPAAEVQTAEQAPTEPQQPQAPPVLDPLGIPYSDPQKAADAAAAPPLHPFNQDHPVLNRMNEALGALQHHLKGFAQPTATPPFNPNADDVLARTYQSPAESQAQLTRTTAAQAQQAALNLEAERRKRAILTMSPQQKFLNQKALDEGFESFAEMPSDRQAEAQEAWKKANVGVKLTTQIVADPDSSTGFSKATYNQMTGEEQSTIPGAIPPRGYVPTKRVTRTTDPATGLTTTSVSDVTPQVPGVNAAPVGRNAPKFPTNVLTPPNPNVRPSAPQAAAQAAGAQATQGGMPPTPLGKQSRMSTPTMVEANPKGLVEAGNIPIWNRPVIQNADGSHSSELSLSMQDDKGHEVLVPTIVDGKFLTPDGKMPPGPMPRDWSKASPEWKALRDAAWKHFQETGENLGKFDNPDNADRYANKLHTRDQGGLDEVNAQIAANKGKAGAPNRKAARMPVSSAAPNPASAVPIRKLDEEGNIPDDPNTPISVVEVARQLLDGQDVNKIPAKLRELGADYARQFGWSQGKFTPREQNQMDEAKYFLTQLRNDPSLGVLDSFGDRVHLAAVPHGTKANSGGILSNVLGVGAAMTESDLQSQYQSNIDQANNIAGGIGQLTRSGRQTEAGLNRVRDEMPNVLRAKNRADAERRIDNLLKEIEIAERKYGVPAFQKPHESKAAPGGPVSANAPKAPGQYKPGERVKLKDGSTVTVKGYTPDGKLQVE